MDLDLEVRRIAEAQRKMNTVSTTNETAYWCRIWRARRRIYRIATMKTLHLTSG